MTEDQERRLRSLAANIVDLELRVELLRATNIAGKSLEERHQMRGDLYVAYANLAEARREAEMIKYGPPTAARYHQ